MNTPHTSVKRVKRVYLYDTPENVKSGTETAKVEFTPKRNLLRAEARPITSRVLSFNHTCSGSSSASLGPERIATLRRLSPVRREGAHRRETAFRFFQNVRACR